MKKILSLLLLFCSVYAIGQSYPDKPNPPRLVNDFTGNTLSTSEIKILEEKLVAFDNQTSNQITVIIIPTTGGYEPTDYATELGRKWGIGNKENNGVLLLVAKDDRKLSIVPGYGLEGTLPDATTQAIIDNDIVPLFKAGNYYQGIENGTESIKQATQGAYKAPEGYSKRGKRGNKTPTWLVFLIIIIVIIFIFGNNNNRNGGMMSRRGYRGLNSPIWWLPIGGGGSGGGGGFSGGGGGFGGFGGGSFGGGGSSGSW